MTISYHLYLPNKVGNMHTHSHSHTCTHIHLHTHTLTHKYSHTYPPAQTLTNPPNANNPHPPHRRLANKDEYSITASGKKVLHITITIENRAEDAHEASFFSTFPKGLSYIEVLNKVCISFTC